MTRRIASVLIACACGACEPQLDGPGTTPPDGYSHDADADSGADADSDSDADADTTEEPVTDRGRLDAQAGVLRVALGADTVDLVPRVRVSGEWVRPTACAVDGEALACTFAAGTVTVSRGADETWGVVFSATDELRLEGVELQGAGSLEGATARMSNGFQSWSQTGVVRLAAPLDGVRLAQSLEARGDGEVVRDGSGPSWFHSWVAGGANALVAGVTGPSPFRPWVDFALVDGELQVRLAQGGTGEALRVGAGEQVELARWFVALGPDLQGALALYGGSVAVMPHSATPDVGWNSWYELWSGVDEQAVRDNAALAQAALGGGPIRVVVDDGWQRAWGDWYPDDGFPSGLDGIASDLSASGISVGVWLAPLLAHEESEVFVAHPEWFVPGVVWNHLEEGRMHVLDVTHPDAAAHLSDTIARLVDDGMSLLKIDFLFAGTFEGDRTEDVTGMQAYDIAMRTIREAAGDDVVLLAVGAPGIPSFPYVQSWRVGPDIAVSRFDASWYFLPGAARTIAGRWMFCGRVLCDGDPPLLRALPRNEVEAGAWIAALAGGALFLSDDLRALAEERIAWLPAAAVAQATSFRGAVPRDLVPDEPPSTLGTAFGDHLTDRGTHVVPSVWTLADGATLLLNVADEPAEIDGTTVAARSAVHRP